MNKFVFVLDVDGVMTNGGMWYTKQEKHLKMFGPDDHDAIKELANYMDVCFVTADKRGYDIVERRIQEEMKCPLYFVSHKPKERWQWIKNKYPSHDIIFMGDGIYDFYSLKNAFYSISTDDALPHVQQAAKYVTSHCGGNRAVAEACLHIMDLLKFDWMSKYEDQ
jgi:3-deoxy-D-manno-octulosonate 8-phosphate phosphatase (KDO 8-P phosphatase)